MNINKILAATVFLSILSSTTVLAQHYKPVEEESTVKFTIVNHLIGKSTVHGTFKGLKGSITFDPKNLTSSSFDVSVEVKTISTGIGKRDRDLQEENYFNEPKFPVITIKSEHITKGDKEGEYKLTASLTMKGVTKTISFPFTASTSNGGYLFKGQFQLNRMDYNVGPDNAIDKNLTVDLSVTAK